MPYGGSSLTPQPLASAKQQAFCNKQVKQRATLGICQTVVGYASPKYQRTPWHAGFAVVTCERLTEEQKYNSISYRTAKLDVEFNNIQ